MSESFQVYRGEVRVEQVAAVEVGVLPSQRGDALEDLRGGSIAAEFELGPTTGVQTQTVVEVIDYDPETAVATFQMPEGDVHSPVVSSPLRDLAATRAPGDLMAITLTEAVAIALEPAIP